MEQQYDVYNDYSNVVLLKIVLDARRYPTDAVLAARAVLARRTVTPEEQAEARIALNLPPLQQATDITAGSQLPAAGANWFTALLVIFGVYCAQSIYGSITQIVMMSKYGSYGMGYYMNNILTVVSLIYLPVAFYLLLKRRRLGWMLALAELVFYLVYALWNQITFFRVADLSTMGSYLALMTFFMVIKIILIVLLLHPAIKTIFQVNKESMLKALLIPLGVLFIFGVGSALFALFGSMF